MGFDREKLPLYLLGVFAVLFVIATVYFGFIHTDDQRQEAEWKSHQTEMGLVSKRIDELTPMIREAQGEARCSQDTDCKVIGLGAQVCDEYRDSLIYSTHDAQEQRLLSLTREFNDLQQKMHLLSLAASSCGKKLPQTQCRGGRCQAN